LPLCSNYRHSTPNSVRRDGDRSRPVSQLKTQPNKPHYDGKEEKGIHPIGNIFLADGYRSHKSSTDYDNHCNASPLVLTDLVAGFVTNKQSAYILNRFKFVGVRFQHCLFGWMFRENTVIFQFLLKGKFASFRLRWCCRHILSVQHSRTFRAMFAGCKVLAGSPTSAHQARHGGEMASSV